MSCICLKYCETKVYSAEKALRFIPCPRTVRAPDVKQSIKCL